MYYEMTKIAFVEFLITMHTQTMLYMRKWKS